MENIQKCFYEKLLENGFSEPSLSEKSIDMLKIFSLELFRAAGISSGFKLSVMENRTQDKVIECVLAYGENHFLLFSNITDRNGKLDLKRTVTHGVLEKKCFVEVIDNIEFFFK